MARRATRNVYLLGLLSLFNDFSADMITPLLPAFLATMGLGAGFLGIMEGTANALANLTVLFSGWLDDRLRRSKRLTVAGYSLCAFLRPCIAIPIPAVTLAVRFLDRIGKGIRTAPRDRLLTASLKKDHWGRAFGVQRAMDHTGSLLGPPIAALLLKWRGVSYSTLFLLASLPAILSILTIPFGIHEAREAPPAKKNSLSWSQLPAPLKRYLVIIFLASFSTPSELFLILKAKSLGLATYQQPLAYGLFTLCTLLAAYLGGVLADRWSQRRTIAVAWTMFALVFFALAFNQSLAWSWLLIAFFGLQSGLAEASERAYPANLSHPDMRATALGWYYFAFGLGMLPASALFGLLWTQFSSKTAFMTYGVMASLVIPLLALLPTHRNSASPALEANRN